METEEHRRKMEETAVDFKSRASKSLVVPTEGEPFNIDGVKILFLMFGGGSAALATWFQNSLTETASVAQKMMLIPILISLSSCVVGLLLTAVLGMIRDKANMFAHQFDVLQAQSIQNLAMVGIDESEMRDKIVEEASENAEYGAEELEETKQRLVDVKSGMTESYERTSEQMGNALEKLGDVRDQWDWLGRGCYAMIGVTVLSIMIGGWTAVGAVHDASEAPEILLPT